MSFDIITARLKGRHLVEASAGTGKTFAIAGIYLRLVAELGYSPSEILVVTFTDAATQELKIRVRQRLRQALDDNPNTGDDPVFDAILSKNTDRAIANIKRAIANFDQARIYTIHAFSQRAKEEMAIARDHERIELSTDSNLIDHSLAIDFFRQTIYGKDTDIVSLFPDIMNIDSFLSIAKSIKMGREIYPKGAFPLDILESKAKKFSVIKEQVTALWQSRKTELLEYFSLNEKYLSRYTPTSLPGYVKHLEEYLFLSKSKKDSELKYFTFSHLSEAIKKAYLLKGWQPVRDEFFLLMDALLQERALITAQQVKHSICVSLKNYMEKNRERMKRELRQKVFDDLLLEVYHGLRLKPELAGIIGKPYKIALIDEFQDTDPVQYEIFHRIFTLQNKDLYMIGDPKQSIYGFRGADIFAYKKARMSTEPITMATNWRSTSGMIGAVNEIFSCENPFIFDWIEYSPVTPSPNADKSPLIIDGKPAIPLSIWHLTDGDSNSLSSGEADILAARATATQIVALIEKGREGRAIIGGKPVTAKDMAILVNKHDEAKIISRELELRGVPHVMSSNMSVLETDEARDMSLLLRILEKPSDTKLIKLLLLSPIFGYSPGRLPIGDQETEDWDNILSDISEHSQTFLRDGFLAAFHSVADKRAMVERLKGALGGLRKLTNYNHLAEIFHNEEKSTGKRGLVKRIEKRIRDAEDHENELRLETEADAVTINTLHSSKGLEWNIVFMPFSYAGTRKINDNDLWELHIDDDEKPITYYPVDDNKDNYRRLTENEALSERLRLIYVGLTRARCACSIAWGNTGKEGLKPLAWLLSREKGENLTEMNTRLKALDPEQFFQSLQTRYRSQNIEVTRIPQWNEVKLEEETKYLETGIPRHFDDEYRPGPVISSFSGMTRGNHSSFRDTDQDTVEEMPKRSADPIFMFPKGAQPGSMIHEAFENIPFSEIMSESETARAMVVDLIGKYNITSNDMDEDVLADSAISMLRNTLHATIPGTDKRLYDLETHYPELQFLMGSPPLAEGALERAFIEAEYMTEYAPRLRCVRSLKGYVKGFIDLIFLMNGKYYILDWKTNSIGGRLTDFTGDRLKREMFDHDYILQYTIYILALHRHLLATVQNYSYDEHIAGALYAFTRGIRPEDPDNGVFFSKPPLKLINKLLELI